MAEEEHTHDLEGSVHETLEQTATFAVAGIGITANLILFIIILLQKHTRTMSSSFILHACFLNAIQTSYCIPFGHGLQAKRIHTSTCNSLGTSYIVFMTASVFNLVAIACCEVYFFDNYCAAQKKRPKGSFCCILFGIFLVYVGSIILHLGPTIIGGNFEKDSENGKCLFIFGQEKNYIVYTMWILIVSIALASATYYLVIFYRVIGKTVEAKLVDVATHQDELNVNMDEVDQKMEGLAELKHNRHRVLAITCVVYFLCWYPLYLLILMDPKYKVTVELYKSLTILGFAKAAAEPFIFLIVDKQVNRILLRLMPCTAVNRITTEDEVNRWLTVTEKESMEPLEPEMFPSHNSFMPPVSDSGIGSRLHNFTPIQHARGWRGSSDEFDLSRGASTSSPARTTSSTRRGASLYNSSHMTEV